MDGFGVYCLYNLVKHWVRVLDEVAQQPMSLLFPFMMISTPINIVFLRFGWLTLYKSYFTLAFICLSKFENTPIANLLPTSFLAVTN